MARGKKYDWPDDQTLQALLDEHGPAETARQVGCPPSSLSRRIRRRGLQGPEQRRKADVANPNGKPDATNSNQKPDAMEPSDQPREPLEYLGSADYQVRKKPENPASNGKPDEPKATNKPETEPGHESFSEKRAPSGGPVRTRMRGPLEYLESAAYRARKKPENPVAVKARAGMDTADERSEDHRPQEDQAARVKTGEDAAPAAPFSVERTSPPKRRGPGLLPRVAQAPRRVPPAIWRSIAVLALAAVAGIAAFIAVSNDPKKYERETSYAVRPSSDVPPDAVNDVLGTLAQPDSAITETIVNMLGSPRLRNFAAQSAGVPEGSVGGSGAEYVWSATRRPGSTIIDIRLTGPDAEKLLAMQTAAAPEAARLVEESYSPYRLETLSAPSPPVQVGPKIARTVGIAFLLGALLGITLVLVERRLRSSLPQREGPARAPAERGDSWEH
jgi:capsular polysaccharide biosynthesis protein